MIQQQLQGLMAQQQERPMRSSSATDGMTMGARESAADYVERLRRAETVRRDGAAGFKRERGLGE